MQATILDLTRLGDERGWLVAVEAASTLPFTVRRVYYIGGAPANVRRGWHAHHRTTQAAVCVSGACSFLLDDGTSRMTVRLDQPHQALLLPPMLWHEMFDFTADCVLLVFADLPFDEKDYIRGYPEFLAETHGR